MTTPVEHAHAEIGLGLGDLGREAGLADMKPVGSDTEAATIGDFDEILKLAQGGAHYIAFIYEKVRNNILEV